MTAAIASCAGRWVSGLARERNVSSGFHTEYHPEYYPLYTIQKCIRRDSIQGFHMDEIGRRFELEKWTGKIVNQK